MSRVTLLLCQLLVAVVFLPVSVSESWAPPPGAPPALWLLGLLTVAVGMPFVLLSLTVLFWGVPGVKRWMARPHRLPVVARDIALEWKPKMPRLHLAIAKDRVPQIGPARRALRLGRFGAGRFRRRNTEEQNT